MERERGRRVGGKTKGGEGPARFQKEGTNQIKMDTHQLETQFLNFATECDISVSKLLGFETFPFFLMVSVSVSKNFGIEKSIGIGFEKFWYRKKVSVLVSKNFGIEKSIGIGFGNFWYRKKYRYRFRKKIGIRKSIGIGFDFFWYRKKYRYRFRNFLVSKKVSVSVSKKIWY